MCERRVLFHRGRFRAWPAAPLRSCISVCVLVVAFVLGGRLASAQIPDRPIITEVFNNPSGRDGPTGRLPGNLHQEFIEIYVPTGAQLRTTLNKDMLRLTLYEIEGDANNSEQGYVNQRIDLPPLDVDLTNGVTSGAVARPSTGVLIVGWVDYNLFDPPSALAGTASTRVALINGGVTSSPTGTLFIPVNGSQFGGTLNFVTPTAESFIDVPNENATGMLRNGSNVYLLVNRDDPGYVRLEDRKHPLLGPSNAFLATGTVLRLSALLDGFAGNDAPGFVVGDQPLVTPTGSNFDLEAILPADGTFSNWIAQVAEASGAGYLRHFVDVLKTTEDGVVGNENPAADSANSYGLVFRSGPFFPTPGKVTFTTSPPELGVSQGQRLQFDVIAGTTGRPGLISANTGGNFPINITATPGASTNPSIMSFGASSPAIDVLGQSLAFPQITASASLSAPNQAVVTAPVSFVAVNAQAGDPLVQNGAGTSTVQGKVLRPSTGVDQLGLPYQATVFAAIEGFGVNPNVANEFLASDLGQFTSQRLGHEVLVAMGHGDILVNPSTDLEDLGTTDPLRRFFPIMENEFINASGAAGTLDLVTTVTSSPKFIQSPSSYASSVNTLRSGLRAYRVDLPETLTRGGGFSPSESVFFVSALGGEFNQRSGLSWATTERTFEIALIDTNVTSTGIEVGGGDDFGVIVRVGQTRPGAAVVPGQFLFLSYTGGLAGEDIDGVNIPGPNSTVAILFDLDNLDTVLGCETITELFIIDGSDSGTLNLIEAISLNPRCASQGTCPFLGDGDRNGIVNLTDLRLFVECHNGPSMPPGGDACSMFDGDVDGDVDLGDYADFQRAISNP